MREGGIVQLKPTDLDHSKSSILKGKCAVLVVDILRLHAFCSFTLLKKSTG